MRLFVIAGLAIASLLPSAKAENTCDAVESLIVDGQGDVPFASLAEKTDGQLRDRYLTFKDAPLLGIFRQCRLQDSLDDIDRPVSTLTCDMEENHGMSRVTQESREEFMAGELATFQALPVCIQNIEGWSGYGNMMSFGGYSVFNKVEATGDPWDKMNGSFKFSTHGSAPLYVGQLTMVLNTVPRDPR